MISAMMSLKFVLFALFFALFVYLLNSAIAVRFKHVQLKPALLYFMTVALIGVFGEIFLDTFYKLVVGHPLWYYNYFPIQHGYTSSYAVVTWGIYGFHLYLLHDSLAAKWSITKTRHLALIFSLEALAMEAMVTLAARAYLGKYMYYYLPSDLWHVSSFQNIPFYFICGVVILQTMKRFRKDPVFFTIMSACLVFVLLFLTR
jgi:hypothetical protein